MTPKEEFRAYMKALNRTSENSDALHLSEAQMFAYCRGEMAATEREAAQAHLLDCDRCLDLFRNARDFLDPQRPDEEIITQTESIEAWRSLNDRLQRELPSDVNTVVNADFQRSRERRILSRVTLALAAGLLLTFGVLGLQSWRLSRERESQRESQERIAQLENDRRELEQRLSRLEQSGADELESERDRRLAAESERDQLLAQLETSPQASEYVPVYSFRLSLERGADDDLQLRLARATKAARLQLLISKPYEFSRFTVEIVESNGKIVQAAAGLRPTGAGGALSLRVSRAKLSNGEYRLRLFGEEGQTRRQLGDYGLSVTLDR